MKFLVTVYASQPVYCEVEVEAPSKEEAEVKALEGLSGNVGTVEWWESDRGVDIDEAEASAEIATREAVDADASDEAP